MRLPVALGVMSRVKKTTNWSGFAPLKNGPASVSPLKVLSETQSSDFLITGSWPAVSLPSPSTETMSGAYIVRMTSKFLPCLHNSTNLLATVLTLMVDSNRWCRGAHNGQTTTHMLALSSLIFAHQAGSFPRNAFGTYQNFGWSPVPSDA